MYGIAFGVINVFRRDKERCVTFVNSSNKQKKDKFLVYKKNQKGENKEMVNKRIF